MFIPFGGTVDSIDLTECVLLQSFNPVRKWKLLPENKISGLT